MQAFGHHGEWHIVVARDGWQLRTAYWWPPEAHSAVVVVSGRGEFIEKYAPLIDELLKAQIAVVCFDWRGQGLSGSTTPPPRRSYYHDFDLLAEDLIELIDEHFQPRFHAKLGPRFQPMLLAHSTGGLITLLALQKKPHLVARAMLLSPMCGLHSNMLPSWLAPLVVRGMCSLGQGMRFAPGQQAFDFALRTPERAARLTSNFARYAEETAALRDNPQLTIGGATYGWLNAAYAGFARLKRPGWAEAFPHPVRILLADNDLLVDNRDTLALAARLPQATTEILTSARHELLQESDPIRSKVVADIVAFATHIAG